MFPVLFVAAYWDEHRLRLIRPLFLEFHPPLIPLFFTHTERTWMSSQLYRNMPKYVSGTFSPVGFINLLARGLISDLRLIIKSNYEQERHLDLTVLFIGLFKAAFHYFYFCKRFWGGTGERMYRDSRNSLWMLVHESNTDVKFLFFDIIAVKIFPRVLQMELQKFLDF